ncbi:MAG: hypothetical protein C0498_07755 [Anaerolinea sp.]|nr:hypothetical protein [Anaerolinea sp.]
MGKNVAVFVDVANIFYAAKAAGVDIDYVTLLKTASAGRDLVRAYAYTGLDPDNENQRNFHDFLRRHGYRVVSKDIRKYGDGKVKANLDIELVVDMMKTARNLDIAIVISGDGDFAPAIRAVQEMGVRVEVISFRGNTSSDLMEVADQFTEITQIARVEKGSSRSGRRVADDEQDLSMTEVPDKQSEGTAARGRGRGRGRAVAAEPVAVASPRARGRSRSVVAAGEAVAVVMPDGTPLVVMPGEKLSRVAAVAAPAAVVAATPDEEELAEAVEGTSGDGEEATGEETRRRRRRRGGRGRGRGRGREEGVVLSAESPLAVEDEDDGPEPMPVPAKRAGFAFGSVWDSQIGMPTASTGGPAPIADDEDLDEPPIPEYLIAERRQRGGRGQVGGRGGAGRGVRGAYAAALDRERFGGGRGAGVNRFAEPAPRGPREDRPRGGRGDDRPRGGDDRPRGDRPASRPVPRPAARSGSGEEPWSEVPPEIEAMLRAQLGGRDARPAHPTAEPQAAAPSGSDQSTSTTPSEARAPRRRTGRPSATVATGFEAPTASVETTHASVETAPAAAPKRRTPRQVAAGHEASPAPATPTEPVVEAPAPKRRATRTAATPTEPVVEAPAPKRRTTRSAVPGDEAVPATAAPVAEPAAPKRRTTRKKADAAGA